MDSPVEQGPVGGGDAQLACLGRVSRKMLPAILHHPICGGGVITYGDNLCLCSGCEWLSAALCLQGGVSSRPLAPLGAALQSCSGAQMGLWHLVGTMGNV